ncbi:hypothetical protein [Azorhizobium sp. AG788]|uniref:hypothetical protein n=1 Tax=Azorhizobium sp. AG788 TaxID=2183897 RepID=UPI003139A766
MATTVPPRPATREEIAILARNAGLDLPPDLFEELVQAYGNVEPMLMRLRRGRDRADEPAQVFDPRKFMPRED